MVENPRPVTNDQIRKLSTDIIDGIDNVFKGKFGLLKFPIKTPKNLPYLEKLRIVARQSDLLLSSRKEGGKSLEVSTLVTKGEQTTIYLTCFLQRGKKPTLFISFGSREGTPKGVLTDDHDYGFYLEGISKMVKELNGDN